MSEESKNDESEGEIHRLALKMASDVTPFGIALGEMLRTLDRMDKRLAAACGEDLSSPPGHEHDPAESMGAVAEADTDEDEPDPTR